MATNRPNSGNGNTTLISVVIVVAMLYFARVVFIPIALAILVSFLLAPLVMRLRHWGLPRVPAVLGVVTLALVLIAVVGGLMTVQLTDLGHKLPEYEQNIHKKVQSVRDSSGGIIRRVTQVMQDFSESINPAPAPSQQTPAGEKPVPVEIRHTTLSPLQMVPAILSSLTGMLLMTVIVVVFVIFMLLQQEDLRDRVIRLVGSRQLNVTTKALDEAGRRVSRYLVAQLIVNVAFGIPAGFALYFLGVPNPILWGVLAALLRYVPYLGIWIAAAMPAAVMFAIDPGWVKPIGVFVIYGTIDLFMYNFVEPPVYGNSTGMTPLAILVAAVFWTWLWGAVGLLLATPLTVCLAVLGRYVPSLRFFGVLLGDEPVLTPEKRLYERLLAEDMDEATDVAEKFLKGKSLEELYDVLIVPTLRLAEEDHEGGRLEEDQQRLVLDRARILVEHIAARSPEIIAGQKHRGGTEARQARETAPPADLAVLSVPARGDADEIVALMASHLLNARGIGSKTASGSSLTSERLEEAVREKIHVVCVSTVSPGGWRHARYLTKRLREQLPDTRIVMAVLAHGGFHEAKKREPILADEIAASLSEAVTQVTAFIPTSEARAGQTAFTS